MKYCDRCKVWVNAPRRHCPLCKGVLADDPHDDVKEEETFPSVPSLYKKYNMFFRVLIFISVCIATAAVSINLLLPETGFWCWMILLGEGGFWVAVATAARRRTSISKRIIWQMVVLSLLTVAVDGLTGWHGWSVDYVVPLVLLFTTICIIVMEMFILSHKVEEYVVYLLVSCGFGLVPLAFALTGLAKVRWPSMLCAASSVITIAAVVLFAGKDTQQEMKKRLHM